MVPDLMNTAIRETEYVFGQHRSGLLRYIKYHLNDVSEAEDVAQESFIRFYQTRLKGEEILKPKAWLFRVAHNLLIDLSRKKKPELLDEKEWLTAEALLVVVPTGLEPELTTLPWDRLTRLELECLRLRTEGLKLREISEVLEISISTVVSYISRALTKLRPATEEKFETFDDQRVAATL